MDFLFEDIDTYESYLNYLRAKDRAISSNIANAETPFYKRLKVELVNTENEIPLRVTSPRHIKNFSSNPFAYKIVQERNILLGDDGNNVDLERELAELEQVALKYESVLKFINGKFNTLELVIKSGGEQ